MSAPYVAAVRDSYTGFMWCGRGLHLLTPENQSGKGYCRTCAARNKRDRRKKGLDK